MNIARTSSLLRKQPFGLAFNFQSRHLFIKWNAERCNSRDYFACRHLSHFLFLVHFFIFPLHDSVARWLKIPCYPSTVAAAVHVPWNQTTNFQFFELTIIMNWKGKKFRLLILIKSLESLCLKCQKYSSGKTQACSHIKSTLHKDLLENWKGSRPALELVATQTFLDTLRRLVPKYIPLIIPCDYFIHFSPPIVPC